MQWATRSSLVSSFSPTSTFLAKQQVVSQRMTNDVLSAKNSDVSDNSAVDLSYRERLQDAAKIRNTCLYFRRAITRRFARMHTRVQMHFAIRYARTRIATCNPINRSEFFRPSNILLTKFYLYQKLFVLDEKSSSGFRIKITTFRQVFIYSWEMNCFIIFNI